MAEAEDLIYPLEHFAVEWRLRSERPVTGAAAVTFVPAGGEADAGSTFHNATWVDNTPEALERVLKLTVAGSDATAQGVHPGVGDFVCWVRYTEGTDVRMLNGGALRFR